MHQKYSSVPLLLAAIISTATHTTASAESTQPNIIFIMADDLGWSDVGYNGAKFYETPHIDRLAAEGMKLNRAYSGGPNCSPTRACLMTGTYTPRHQIWTPGGRSKGNPDFMKLLVPRKGKSKGNKAFPSKQSLDPAAVSIAEILKPAGYKTAMLGKWHLGNRRTQGFDLFSADGSARPYKNHYGSIRVANTLTNRAVQYIEENQSNPFFLYLSHWDVHTPHRAQKLLVEKYKAKLNARKWEGKWNPVYAAMIEAFDQSVGRIRETVEKHGLSEKTLIIVTSDNGSSGAVKTGPLKGAKGSLCEGGVRVPTAMIWPGTIPSGSECDDPITSVDFLPTFVDLAGADLPKTQPVDGVSIRPLFLGQPLPERSIFWHFPLYLSANGHPVLPIFGTDRMVWRATPATMIVRGDWKLTFYYEDRSVKLYNLNKDPYETTELASQQPERTEQLLTELKAWVKATGAPEPFAVNEAFQPNPTENTEKRRKGHPN